MHGLQQGTSNMSNDRFYSDMMNLATQSPRDAADVTMTWRNRFLNMATGGQVVLHKGLSVATGVTIGFGYGVFQGRCQAEDDDIQEDWRNGGYASAGLATADDGSPYREGNAALPDRYPSMAPGTLFGVPWTLIATIATGALAIFKVGGENWNHLLESGAFAGVVYWSGQMGDKVGYDWKRAAIEAADADAQGGQAAA